ncbi:hypothetical protein [Streptomyces sp. BH055]|uniref:hypothetical protein n=1 Tax=unclassified Streptomyces TaxID=2593676 RepID=UPI003BB5D29E
MFVGTLKGLVGRYFIAVSLGDDGSFGGGNGFWRLGDPCTICGPRYCDPSVVRMEPCRNPRGHAWSQVHAWQSSRVPESQVKVFAPRASSVEEARARAVEMAEEIRVHGHLL